ATLLNNTTYQFNLIPNKKITQINNLVNITEHTKPTSEKPLNDINSKGIKTPIAFVRYLAELTVNLGGGKVSIAGNEKEACISYDEIPSWEQMKQKYLLDDVSEERLVRLFRQTVERFGEKLGFSCNVDAKLSHPVATIIFKAPLKKTV
ncbi:MAG: hypothetical protein K2Z81_27150, partial [Cyanobacteria bacterium]|nr:hypothetical protein [Cyanobacteriota bacterium]